MHRLLRIFTLVLMTSVMLPSITSAQYYVKKKQAPKSQSSQQTDKKDEATSSDPYQEGFICSEEDKKNLATIMEAMEVLEDPSAPGNGKKLKEVIEYLQNPENAKYMVELRFRCRNVL